MIVRDQTDADDPPDARCAAHWTRATASSTPTCWSFPPSKTTTSPTSLAWTRPRAARRWRARDRGEFTGKPFESLVLGSQGAGWRRRASLLVGAGAAAGVHGRRAAADRDHRRRWPRRQRRLDAARAPAAARDDAWPRRTRPQALAEGVILANYEGASLQDRRSRPASGSTTCPSCGCWATAQDLAAARGARRVLGECTNLARALSNEPGNRLTPRVFADRGAGAGDGRRPRRRGARRERRSPSCEMGLLLGVAQGSEEPPRLLVLRHEPASAVSKASRSGSSARASRSTPAASRSSRPRTWTR